ncbi:MAG: flavodoxin family protein [Candidatus Geothermincolia bacterium]
MSTDPMAIRNIVAVNGSPRAKNGMTDIIVRRFLAGAESAGAETDVLYPAKLKISPCLGCMRCWFETPGVCRHKDGMPALMARVAGADLAVLASPVYVDGMTAQMKAMFDRCISYTPPFFEYDNGRSYHPSTTDRRGRVVIVSTCGFPERKHFDPIALHFNRICENMRSDILGEFYFPASSLIATDPHLVEANLEAVYRAGREIVESGEIDPATVEQANADYVKDPEAIGRRINEVFHAVLKHHGVEK